MMFRITLFVQVGLLLCATAFAQGSAETIQLVEIIEASLSAGKLIYPIDCVVRIEETTEFEGTGPTGNQMTFRLQLDSEKEKARWFGVEKRAGQDGDLIGNLKVFGSEIDHDVLKQFSFGGGQGARQESFKQALAESLIPLPHTWGVLRFPFFGKGLDELARVSAIITSPDTTVTIVEEKDGSLLCTARMVRSEQEFDVYRWWVNLPEYTVSKFTIDRSATGTLLRYWTQEIIWEERNGIHVPTFIASETMAGRKREGQEPEFEFAEQRMDIELAWIRAGQDDLTEAETRTFKSAKDVIAFVEEGRERATGKRSVEHILRSSQ